MSYEYTNTSEYSEDDVFAQEIYNRISALYKRLGNSESSIKLLGDAIILKVNTKDFEDGIRGIESRITLTLDEIELRVSNFESELGDFQSTLSVQAGLISSKVSMTDITGQIIMSKIEQTPTNIKLQASRIELDGITHFNGNVEVGKGWEAGAVNGAKRIRFGNAGELVWYDGFEYWSAVHGHDFIGDVRLRSGDTLRLTGVNVVGLNVTVAFG